MSSALLGTPWSSCLRSSVTWLAGKSPKWMEVSSEGNHLFQWSVFNFPCYLWMIFPFSHWHLHFEWGVSRGFPSLPPVETRIWSLPGQGRDGSTFSTDEGFWFDLHAAHSGAWARLREVVCGVFPCGCCVNLLFYSFPWFESQNQEPHFFVFFNRCLQYSIFLNYKGHFGISLDITDSVQLNVIETVCATRWIMYIYIYIFWMANGWEMALKTIDIWDSLG